MFATLGWGFTDFVKRGGEDRGSEGEEDEEEDMDTAQKGIEEEDVEVSSTAEPDSQERESQEGEPDAAVASGKAMVELSCSAPWTLCTASASSTVDFVYGIGLSSTVDFVHGIGLSSTADFVYDIGPSTTGDPVPFRRALCSGLWHRPCRDLPKVSRQEEERKADPVKMWALGSMLMMPYTAVVVMATGLLGSAGGVVNG
eukprot:symbB.v1.2.041822.t1/scaffold8694.1/size5332/1